MGFLSEKTLLSGGFMGGFCQNAAGWQRVERGLPPAIDDSLTVLNDG
jgi:hypothetical protein